MDKRAPCQRRRHEIDRDCNDSNAHEDEIDRELRNLMQEVEEREHTR
jgi:hypothetical protein